MLHYVSWCSCLKCKHNFIYLKSHILVSLFRPCVLYFSCMILFPHLTYKCSLRYIFITFPEFIFSTNTQTFSSIYFCNIPCMILFTHLTNKQTFSKIYLYNISCIILFLHLTNNLLNTLLSTTKIDFLFFLFLKRNN